MMPRPLVAILSIGLLGAVSAADAQAQARASERAMVSQTIDGTTLTIEYSRPRARGRDDLFGGVVHWGEVWTPGANYATTLEANKPLKLDGHDIPAGKYSVWMVVNQDDWEFVLDPQVVRFHTDHPKETDAQIRFPIRAVEAAAHEEALTWSFPGVRPDGATLSMHWGNTAVPLDVRVEPSYRRVVTKAEAAPYVGSFELTPQAPPGEPQPPGPAPFVVRHAEDGSLIAATMIPSESGGFEPGEMVLLPKAEGIFTPAFILFGELDTADDLYVEFKLENGRATTFDLRGPDDVIYARGRRAATRTPDGRES